MIICTSVCANYLPKAMVLARSVKQHNPDAKIVVNLVEREIHPVAKEFPFFDQVVLAKDLGFEDFDRFIFKHSIVEASTSVKGQIFIYLLNKFKDEEKFIYLDPDITVLGPFDELNSVLDTNDIVLTPHLCHPEEMLDAVMDNELCALQHGVFNLGFLAIRRSPESERFINWWATRLDMFCYDDIPRGIFTDQKWIDLAPGFFNIFILKHPGYNAAPWNLSKRKITVDQSGKYMVNGVPLRFFHFSGFDSGANEFMINKYAPDRQNAIYYLRDKYVEQLKNMGQDTIGNEPWSYDYYKDGTIVDRAARIIFRDNPELFNSYPDPFNESNHLFLSKKVLPKKYLIKVIRKVLNKVRG